MSASEPLLSVQGIEVRYGALTALSDLSFQVEPGKIVALLGPNGSGKSTLVNAIGGTVGVHRGEIWFDQTRIDGTPAYGRPGLGVSLVPERRRLFPYMSVLENIQLGVASLPKHERQARVAELLDLFPQNRLRADRMARVCSGGEQQLVSLARGLGCRPSLVMIDEPFLGLSPDMRKVVGDFMRRIVGDEVQSVVFIEQNVQACVDVADVIYVLRSGRVVASGPAEEFRDTDRVRKLFLGA